MRGIVAIAVAVAFLGTEPVARALADGERPRGAAGRVPPGLREPWDPPPPPPSEPVPFVEPGTHVCGSAFYYSDWTFWWAHNEDGLLAIKGRVLWNPRQFGVSQALNAIDSPPPLVTDLAAADEQVAVPALLRVLDVDEADHPKATAAACIALAKIATRPEHVERLVARIVDADPNVSASAALGLGLLRRSERSPFDTAALDRIRAVCLRIFDDPACPLRTRANAMFSIGILGDQPSANPPFSGAWAASAVQRLADPAPPPDLTVALLIAISLQPPASIAPDLLRAVAARFEVPRAEEPYDDLLRAHAAQALGRIGTKEHVLLLLAAVRGGKNAWNAPRSTALALGDLGVRLSGADRASVGLQLLEAVGASKDITTRSFAWISLGRLLEADARNGSTASFEAGGGAIVERLFSAVESTKDDERPYAGLALALPARWISGESAPPLVAFYRRALDAMRARWNDVTTGVRQRAAIALASGIMGSRRGVPLAATLSDLKAIPELRGMCAVSLGLVGEATPDATHAVRGAWDRADPSLRGCLTLAAAGLWMSHDTRQHMREVLATVEDTPAWREALIAQSRAAGPEDVAALAGLVRGACLPDASLAAAATALGIAGDAESVPSLSRLAQGMNWRASTGTWVQALWVW